MSSEELLQVLVDLDKYERNSLIEVLIKLVQKHGSTPIAYHDFSPEDVDYIGLAGEETTRDSGTDLEVHTISEMGSIDKVLKRNAAIIVVYFHSWNKVYDIDNYRTVIYVRREAEYVS